MTVKKTIAGRLKERIGRYIMKKNMMKNKPYSISNLKDLIEHNTKTFGDKPLYYYKDGGEVKEFTYNQMNDAVNQLGTAFYSMGVMGKRVAVIGEASPYYMVTYFAAANGGGTIVPLDKELDNEAIAGFINLSDVQALAYTESFNDRVSEIAEKAPGVRFFISLQPASDFTEDEKFLKISTVLENGRALISEGENSFTSFMPDSEKLAALLFTSGTTGTSKGVMLSHKNLAAATNASCDSMNHLPQTYRFVSVLPMNHSYEVTCGHLALSNIGCCTYLNDSLKNALKSFNYFKPNALILVPLFVETIHKRIWKEIDKRGMRKKVRFAMKLSGTLRRIGIDIRKKLFKDILSALGGNLDTIICGGAPLSKELVTDFDAFGIEILEGYGITECSPLLSVNRTGKVKPGSVGTPVLGCQIRIDKSPNEETGEILAKGDNVMMGYLNNPEATAEVFTEDGWFRTGDIGYIDGDGYIYITGRKKNIIILSNGKNIFPEELEEHLYHNEIIAECVVIGRKNDSGDTVITAVIYPNYELCEGKSDDEILAMLKQAVTETNKKLPTFKHIGNVELRKTEFEKTTTKKIKRFLVK